MFSATAAAATARTAGDAGTAVGAVADAAGDAVCCAPIGVAPLDETEAAELAGILKALADPVRLRLVSIIAGAPSGEVCACDLPALVERAQPTTSHHLSLLVKAGILDREQRGKWAWFRVRTERLRSLADVLASPDIHSIDIDSTMTE